MTSSLYSHFGRKSSLVGKFGFGQLDWLGYEYLFTATGVKKMKWFLPSHKVPFPATSDRRSRVAGNGTE